MATLDDFLRDFRMQMGELREGLLDLRNILLTRMKQMERNRDRVAECK